MSYLKFKKKERTKRYYTSSSSTHDFHDFFYFRNFILINFNRLGKFQKTDIEYLNELSEAESKSIFGSDNDCNDLIGDSIHDVDTSKQIFNHLRLKKPF
jgi:hypothetical protein